MREIHSVVAAGAKLTQRISLKTFVVSLFLCLGMEAPLVFAEEGPVIVYRRFHPTCSECSKYELKIFGNGRVVYEGTVLYRQMGNVGITIETGIREKTILPELVGKWIDLLLNANFFSQPSMYFDLDNCPLDRGDQSITLSLEERTNTVRWYWCRKDGFPAEIGKVAQDIREQVQHEQWVKKMWKP